MEPLLFITKIPSNKTISIIINPASTPIFKCLLWISWLIALNIQKSNENSHSADSIDGVGISGEMWIIHSLNF